MSAPLVCAECGRSLTPIEFLTCAGLCELHWRLDHPSDYLVQMEHKPANANGHPLTPGERIAIAVQLRAELRPKLVNGRARKPAVKAA